MTDRRFRVTETQADQIAEKFGTPAYVVDETHFRERIRAYRRAFEAVAPKCQLCFAGKANSVSALLKIAWQEGCVIDAASEGELRAAMLAGIPTRDCHLHGNNKSDAELAFAAQQGIGEIVVDNFAEIESLVRLGITSVNLVLRLAPGVDPKTHAKISTGQADTKFGFNIADGSAEKALLRCLELKLPVIGVHCHVGSQILDASAQEAGGATIAEFVVRMWKSHGWIAKEVNVGGGRGIHYVGHSSPITIEDYNKLVVNAIMEHLSELPEQPKLLQEPGRSLIGESGVTLYRVGVIKEVPASDGRRTYVCVDGGLSDNPRPAMYGSLYTVESFRKGDGQPVTVSGKHCETDTLFPDISLPKNLQEGDLIQVLCTGAYNASMASNYNRLPRPVHILIRSDGSFNEIQRRESFDQILSREVIPEGLK